MDRYSRGPVKEEDSSSDESTESGIPADCIDVIKDVEEYEESDKDDYSSKDGDKDEEPDEDDDEISKRDEGSQEGVDEEDDHSPQHVILRKRSNRPDNDGGPEECSEGEVSYDEDAAARKRNNFDDVAASMTLKILTEEFTDTLASFISKRKEAIELLKVQVKRLNDCKTNGNITKITGAGVSIVGAVAALASIPLTGGLSILALSAGGLFSAVGGVTGIGGRIYFNSRENGLMERAHQIAKSDQEEAEKLQQALDALHSLSEKMDNRLIATGAIGTVANIGGIFKGVTVVLSVVFIPLNIWQIVNCSLELRKDNSENAQLVCDLISNLEKDLAEKEKLLV